MYIYIVVVVGPVEMWKSHFIVDTKEIVFHRGVEIAVENNARLWKSFLFREFSTFPQGTLLRCLWKCGKL